MKRLTFYYSIAFSALLSAGCEMGSVGSRIGINAPDSGHKDVWDAAFRRRHRDLKGPVAGDPMLELAREITVIEDDIRRDGSITVKQPDVWGDGNLIASIQEYERLMSLGENAEFDNRFQESVQAYIARSDQGEFQSVTAIGTALSGATSAPATVPKDGIITQITNTTADQTTFHKDDLFAAIGANTGPLKVGEKLGVALEPTELDRQRSTFIHANQALRRRMIGDDNSRAAGYGLYLFRIPVSVIPGRETTEGHSAVVTLRAQLQIQQNHLKETFGRLAIADLVEGLAPTVLTMWDAPEAAKTKGNSRMMMANGSTLTPARITPELQDLVFGSDNIKYITEEAKKYFGALPPGTAIDGRPQLEEVKRYLSTLFEQTHIVLQENNLYSINSEEILYAGDDFVKGQMQKLETHRNAFETSVRELNIHEHFLRASWALAMQSAILDRNLKRILDEMANKGQLSHEQCAHPEGVAFFVSDNPDTLMLWESIVQDTFPLHVFNLDPIAEEQNAYDAFARRREMQVALAFSVAKGSVLNADQKLKMSRRLALDEATIALNRTAIAFAHSEDTFGWYFHPRVQTPPVESSNLGALARTIWSTGPTEHYDRKHRRLEPGIRDCEVLISMPTFVTEVSFDVTTNWEKVARPGVTKRSYEEMIAQGGRIHRLRNCMNDPSNQQCYRPGDLSRMVSRIDQLEKMLGMQTHNVRVPFEPSQSGTGLFDTGNRQLVPSIDYYYGLTYLDPAQTKADLFISGKNFHPTLTHVIVGGSEFHTNSDTANVEVISRELLHVSVGSLMPSLSQGGSKFEVRVATPRGMSNPLVIEKKPAEKPETKEPTPKSSYDLIKDIELIGSVGCKADGSCGSRFCLTNPPGSIRIVVGENNPFIDSNMTVTFSLTRKHEADDDKKEPDFLGNTSPINLHGLEIDPNAMAAAIKPIIENAMDYQAGDEITIKLRLTLQGPPLREVVMTSAIKLTLVLNECPTPAVVLPPAPVPIQMPEKK